MNALLTRPGRAPAIVAGLMLLQLGLVALLLRANHSQVFLLGQPIGSECAFHHLTGLACPTCGMTRSVILTLHGHLREAARVNPAGPVWVSAVAMAAIALFWIAWRRHTVSTSVASNDKRRIVTVVATLGALLLAVLFWHWIRVLLAHG